MADEKFFDPFNLKPGETISLDDAPLLPPELEAQIKAQFEDADALFEEGERKYPSVDGPAIEENEEPVNLPVVQPHSKVPAKLSNDVDVPGRTLILIDHAGQELTEFCPAIANIERSKSKVVWMNLANSDVAKFQESMGCLEIGEWDIWGFRRPPPDLTDVTSRLSDLFEQWNPDTIFALSTSTAVAALTMCKPRPGRLFPRLLLHYTDGFYTSPIALTCDKRMYKTLCEVYEWCYKEVANIKGIQTYVEPDFD